MTLLRSASVRRVQTGAINAYLYVIVIDGAAVMSRLRYVSVISTANGGQMNNMLT